MQKQRRTIWCDDCIKVIGCEDETCVLPVLVLDRCKGRMEVVDMVPGRLNPLVEWKDEKTDHNDQIMSGSEDRNHF